MLTITLTYSAAARRISYRSIARTILDKNIYSTVQLANSLSATYRQDLAMCAAEGGAN